MRRVKTFLIAVIVSSIISGSAFADYPVLPGFKRVSAEPLLPGETQELLQQSGAELPLLMGDGDPNQVDPEIAELARGLRYDPNLMWRFVHNYIDFTPMFGDVKGAYMTLMDRSGNAFDQASLLIALLRQAGYQANYVYGELWLNSDDVANWLGVPDDPNVIERVLACGGIPFENIGVFKVYYHVWVKANIGGTDYQFDPSLKSYNYTQGINLQSIMEYDQTDFLDSVTEGASGGSGYDYIQNLNVPNLINDLFLFSAHLINYIEADNNSSPTLADIIGGREIVQATCDPSQPLENHLVYGEWTEIPPQYKTSFRIEHCGINTTLYSSDIYGRRLSIFYDGLNRPVLWLDGQELATGNPVSGQQDLIFDVNHPYPYDGWTYCDESKAFSVIAGNPHVIVNGWGNTGAGGTGIKIIESHRKKLKHDLHAGYAEGSEQVLGESLTLVGLTWLAECTRAKQLCGQIGDTSTLTHHMLGVIGQNQSPYIDMPLCSASYINHANDSLKEDAVFFTTGGLFSAFEWGVIEQLQDHNSISTVKLLDISNGQSDKIFEARSDNYGSIEPQLKNYDSGEKAQVEAFINGGCRVILPEDGDLGEGIWEGIGFLAVSPDEDVLSYIISGNYNGGYGAEEWMLSNVDTSVTDPVSLPSPTNAKSWEPIDLVTGAYTYEHTDLHIGSGDWPFSLELRRYYNSNSRFDDGPLGLGWTHNFDISAQVSSDGFQGMGIDSPADAVASIVATYISIDLLSSSKSKTNLMAATLIHKWFMEELIDNVVTINQPGNTMQFVKRPHLYGALPHHIMYSSPPGEASELKLEANGGYKLSNLHGYTSLYFDLDGKVTSWTDTHWFVYPEDPNIHPVHFTYYADGKLSQISNAFGRFLNFFYDGNNIDYVTDSAGRVVDYSYDDVNNLTLSTDANGFSTNFIYDANNDGQLLQIYYPSEPNTSFVTNVYDSLERVMVQNDANGRPYNYYFSGYRTEEVDPAGFSTVHFFDKYGNNVILRDKLGRETVSQYDGQQRKIFVTYPRGNAVQWSYDRCHNIIEKIRIPAPGSSEPNIVEKFTYEESFLKIRSYTDPRNNVTDYVYGYDLGLFPLSDLMKITYPEVSAPNGTTRPIDNFTYYDDGLMETYTDPEGTVTRYEYDPVTRDLLRIIRDYNETDPNHLNLITEMTYNTVGDANSTIDPLGNTTKREYNPLRQLIKETAPAPFNYVTIYERDPDGEIKYLKRQTGEPNQPWQVTSYTYTPTRNEKTVTDPNGDVTQYEYDLLDRLWKTTDAKSNITERLYNAAGQLWKIIDAEDNETVTYEYTVNGRVEKLTDARGKITNYEYDFHDRLKKTIYPDSTYEQLSYDDAGNITTKRTRAGQNIGYSYDALNRIETKTLPGPQQIQYVYDLTGRTKTVTDSAGTIQNSYDSVGRLSSVTYPDGKNVSYQYDAGGNRTRLTYPDGTYITYDYDQLNRLTFIRDDDGSMIAHYDYDTLSRRTGMQLANGTSANYTYSIADNLLYLNNQMNGASKSFAYSYDSVGNRLTMTTDETNLHDYSYDKIYQLTWADYPAGYFAADTTFIYDPAANRKWVIGGVTTGYTVNSLNQYTLVGGVAYSYDNNGNLTNDGQYTYIYDCENRLIEVRQAADTIATYAYDYSGRRIQKTQYAPLTTQNYIYDGDQVICEYSDPNILVRKFVYGTGIDEVIRMSNCLPSADIVKNGTVDFGDYVVFANIWLLDANDAGFDPNADLWPDNVIDLEDLKVFAENWLGTGDGDYYYHYDGLGSVIALTDSAGNMVETYNYDVYGQFDSQSSLGNPYYFTGRRRDTETALYYYRARFYNPAIGRFMQTDPVGYEESMNLYLYCWNNPVIFVDPAGRVAFMGGKAKIKIKTSSGTRKYTVGAAGEVKSILEDVRESGESISEFEYVGHGFNKGEGLAIGEGGIVVGSAYSDNEISINELKELVTSTFDPQAIIELESCYSAAGDTSIAAQFKKMLPGAKVYGYTGKTKPWLLFDETWSWFGSDWVEVKK